MAKHYTIASPYAKAIFEQALANNQLEAWAFALQGLSFIAEDARVIGLWRDPKVAPELLKTLFFEVFEKCLADVATALNSKLKNLIALLVAEKRLAILSDISALYQRLLAEHKNIVEIEVLSAFTLDEAQQKQFYLALEKRFSSKISITFKEDKDLIGGSLLRSGNWVLDGSVRGKISRLNDSLIG